MLVYKFVGKRKKLIPNGWKFHKLYARNYQCYNKNDIWLFVINKMIVEINNIPMNDQHKVISFILDNSDKGNDFWTYLMSEHMQRIFGKNSRIDKYRLIKGMILDDQQRTVLAKFYYDKEELPPSGVSISSELIDTIIRLNTIGSLQTQECN